MADVENGKKQAYESSYDETTSPADSDFVPAAIVTPAASVPLQDGGMRAWLQVVGSFLVFSNLWGFVFAFGSFQSFYQLDYLSDQTPSDISWIGTIATGLLIFVGILSGPLFDLGYFRSMLIVGGLGETLAIFLLSLCTKYYQILLTQGLLCGLTNGESRPVYGVMQP